MLDREMRREKNLEARLKELKQRAKRDAAKRGEQRESFDDDSNVDSSSNTEQPEVTSKTAIVSEYPQSRAFVIDR